MEEFLNSLQSQHSKVALELDMAKARVAQSQLRYERICESIEERRIQLLRLQAESANTRLNIALQKRQIHLAINDIA